MARPTAPAAALALLLAAACGGRTESLGESSPGPGGGGATDADTPGTDARALEILEGPLRIFPEDERLAGAKVVARSGGFDVLANRDGSPHAVLVRRAVVTPDPPSVRWAAPAEELLPGVVSGTAAAANGAQLAVCHHQYNGDASSFSTFTGAYEGTSGPLTLRAASSCQGLAFHEGAGVLALHALPASGTSRAEVFTIDGAGGVDTASGELALPEGEPGDVRVAEYPGGVAWAGLVGSAEARGLHVGLRRDADTRAHTVALDAPGDRPDLAGWPFEAAVALTVPREVGVRLLVVHEAGSVLLDEALTPPPGEHLQRVPLGSSTHGLVAAYARCAEDFSATPGAVVVELRRPHGDTLQTSLAISGHAYVSTLAVVGEIIFIVYSAEDTLWGVIARIVT